VRGEGGQKRRTSLHQEGKKEVGGHQHKYKYGHNLKLGIGFGMYKFNGSAKTLHFYVPLVGC
jgi:hypothetical protein